ncbi:protein-export chaperone SecB [Flavobacterium sp. PL002]|jgi:preprotein translocase subunit SecB|uniref:protein-export chaperone SecB n=1 Tax=Flavobacterium sp. PL002 TaxID=1897058 RepID=UPI00178788CE|nr:protein-export chaperone SecB [Flavobacterium sp. PL002]MBE0393438.1 Protein-export protein SecB [Flavobacterium sp. PL002]
METQKASIQFLKFFVKESYISFNEIGEYKIKIDFDANASVKKSVNKYHLIIETVISEAEGKLNIRVVSESIFDYDNDLSIEELKDGLFTKNAPAIVFPYIRAYIASLTAISGVPTLNLPTLNLTKLGEQLLDKMTIEE